MASISAIAHDENAASSGQWQLESFLQKVTVIVPSVIYVFNQKTQSNEYSNRSLGVAMGYSAAEVQEMGANLMPKVCHPDDLPAIATHFANIRAMQDGDILQLEYRMRHKEGHWVWLLSYDTVFDRDDDGNVLRHIGVATDITAQKEAEMRAVADKRQADIANEELRALSYSLSHDLKAPTNTLRVLLNELSDHHGSSIGKEEKELVSLSLQTVANMETLIENVLHYTNVVGREFEKEAVCLKQVVHGAVASLDDEIRESRAEIMVAELPSILGNPALLEVLFRNLLGNALKFREPTTAPRVSVDCAEVADNEIKVSVLDNGIGVPAEAQERIFKLFQRLHMKEDYPGTGLGLTVCRRIAVAHGGDITVEPAPDGGSVFAVTLNTE
ncbi:MAG: ATP-binding protein [Pseudomonadota bacterium]